MSRGHRQERIGEEIRHIVSDLLRKGLKDPRLDAMISVTGVDVTSDYRYATVYFTVLGTRSDDEFMKEITEGFASSQGFIRREIGRQLKLRHTPELIFRPDCSEEYGRHIEEIIDSLECGEEAKAAPSPEDTLEEE